jgi:hypothetical protein
MILLRIDVVSCSNFNQREKSEQRAVKFIKMLLDNIVLKNVFTFSAAYLKLSFSLLNSNQRKNLILKKWIYFNYYDIVIILTNVD